MPPRGITEVRDFLSPPFVLFFSFSHHGPRPGSSILMPPRGITGVCDFLCPPFFLSFPIFFFHSFAPRSLTGFHHSHAIPRHNKSLRLPFSYIVPFPFSFFFFLAPRSSTAFLYSEATLWHNRSPRLTLSQSLFN